MWAVKRNVQLCGVALSISFWKCLFVISNNSLCQHCYIKVSVLFFYKHFELNVSDIIFTFPCLEQAYSSLKVHLKKEKKGTHFICPFKTGPVRRTSLLFHALLMSPWQHTSPCRRLPNWQCKTERTHPAIHPAPTLSWAEALPMLLISWYMEIQPVTYQMNRHFLAIKSGIALFIFQRLIC